jgi:hypothetical protein
MELLPPTLADSAALLLAGDILSVHQAGPSRMALRLRLMQPDVSWSALLDLASQHGLLVPLVHALKRDALLLPVRAAATPAERESHVTTRLEAAYNDHLARRADLTDQLQAIIAALGKAGIAPLLLKGARHLVAPLSPWSTARVMRDLDICVAPDRLDEAVAALHALGYRPIEEGTAFDHHAPAMARPGRHGAVELHVDALALGGRRVLTTAEAWERSETIGSDAGPFRVLRPAWHLLHGLLHHQVAERGHRRQILALKGLFEFASLGATLSPAEWQEIADHMAARGETVALGSWLAQAGLLFGLALPAGLTIDPEARRHAEETLARAGDPYWKRRIGFIADQLRFAFARETLAHRYGIAERDVSLVTALNQAAAILSRYGTGIVGRLAGRQDRSS